MSVDKISRSIVIVAEDRGVASGNHMVEAGRNLDPQRAGQLCIIVQ